ncbi:hypothetical protein F1D05_29810 [Kribbella qitaiheensis]|uniref:Uncharacterized protein n=1 Tax=Kribbella qitaiheensis TaxID=1544730 RepID=A0A7G6X536_9ACTN|nr:hypothetical protein [Kribbella qitaiheensis]QNE21351.1 hypothetical protein F1D05_29810 [Kribbella qitaiheensis]
MIPGRSATTVPLPQPIATGQSYDIEISVAGGTIETRIDGQLVDTTTGLAAGSGKVGFRQSNGDGERATVAAVSVTAPDGTVLLADDFTNGLDKWDSPGAVITGTNLTTTSCGGQPTDVLPIKTNAGTIYLYQSDVWMDAKANEALAKHYWQPLRFDDAGVILPIECGNSYQVTIPTGRPAILPPPPAISTGHAGYRTHWDVSGSLARAQTFTIPKSGKLTGVRFTSFQSGHPNAPVTLELKRVHNGAIGATVQSVEIPANQVSWAARWVGLRLDRPLPVQPGDQFALTVSTKSATGAYGIAYTDADPYGGGQAMISHDAGATWQVESNRSLHLEAEVTP